MQFSLGHLCYGNHPLLVDNFCIRGMTLAAKLSDRLDVSINSMNANAIVGFDNFTGLSNFGNNITSASVGLQLVKNQADGVRLEATFTDGKRRPEGNFNEGQVLDAEQSQGFGLRLRGSDNSGRWKFDTGFARSKFTNLPDEQLIGDGEIIPVKPVTKNALYAEVSYDLIKDMPLGSGDREGNSFTGVGTVNSGGVAGFPLPVLRYFVQPAKAGDQTLTLLTPSRTQLAGRELITFRWQPVTNAQSYKLEVQTTCDQALVLSAVLDGKTTTYVAPSWFQKSTQQAMRWRVTAIAQDGKAIAQSQWQQF